MIKGYLDIPEKLRLKNEIFFGNAKFHGDYKYEWNEKKRILIIYCKRSNLDGKIYEKVLLYRANLKSSKLHLID